MSAVLRDDAGNPVNVTITFTTGDASVVTVTGAGNVTAQGPGTTTISVAAGGAQKSVPVTVTASPLVMVASDSLVVHPLQAIPLNASVQDCHGDQTGTVLTFSGFDGNIATVSVGDTVTGVAYGSTSVTVQGAGLTKDVLIRVIGRPTGNAVTSVPLSDTPFGVAVSDAGVIYVTQIGGSTMGRATSPLSAFNGSIGVGLSPAHVVMNAAGTTAYVTNQGGNSVSVVDIATQSETLQIPLGNPAFNLIVSPNGQTLYATVDVGTVYVINTGTNAVVGLLRGGACCQWIGLQPGRNQAVCKRPGRCLVVIYDTLSNATIDSLVTGGSPRAWRFPRTEPSSTLPTKRSALISGTYLGNPDHQPGDGGLWHRPESRQQCALCQQPECGHHNDR
jgi:YVTN family beta-propeller protein